MTPERILELAAKCDLIDSDEPVIDFAQAILKERDEEQDSIINMQDIAIEQQAEEIAQLREQLAAFEGEPLVGWWHSGETEDESDFHQFKYGAGESCGRCIPLIRKPPSTTHIEAIKQEVRDKALEEAAKVCDSRYMGDNNREDLEARRCAEAIRAMKGRK